MDSKKTTYIVICILLSTPVFSEIVVFQEYDTTFTLEDDILTVEKELRLKNVGSSPIIPGEIHFKVSQQGKDGNIPAQVYDYSVIDRNEEDVDTEKIVGKDATDLVFTIWEPLLPKFYYDFSMTYKMDFKTKGILFHEIQVPEEQTTIPIKESTTSFQLPKSNHITYAPEGDISKTEDYRVIEWDDKSALQFEYTFLPLPKTPVRMINIFWVTVILISLIVLVIRFTRSNK
ncbi:MAG: hypothetical protein R6V53_06865 [Candidatus Woesearchaeota archaeon]